MVLGTFITKLGGILSTTKGLLVGAAIVVADFFTGYGLAFVSVFICIMGDAVFGVWAAIKQGKYAKSELARDTFSKIAAYGFSLVVVAFVEHMMHIEGNPICVSIIAAAICLVEFWSLSANALIVNPNLHFFKILQPALRGELARKLNITEDEVEEALKTKATKKKNAKSN